MIGIFAVSWFLTFGYVPVQTDRVGNEINRLDKTYIATVADIGLSAKAFNRFSVYGSFRNYQYKHTEGLTFLPFRIDYTAGIAFKITENITFNVDHECDHEVIFQPMENYKISYGKSETIISITFSGGVKRNQNE